MVFSFFVFAEFNGGSVKAAAKAHWSSVACLCRSSFFCCLVSLFVPFFSLPAGLMPASPFSSSCCLVRATAVTCSSSARVRVVLAAFLILHHVIQNFCRRFLSFFSYMFVCVLACLVVLSYPRYARFSLDLTLIICGCFCFVCLSVCDHQICISLG